MLVLSFVCMLLKFKKYHVILKIRNFRLTNYVMRMKHCMHNEYIIIEMILKFAILQKGIGIESEKVCKQVRDQIHSMKTG